MDENKEKTRKLDFKITRSWQYLAYIYVVLPGLLFLLALLTKSPSLSNLYHTYNIFGISTWPDLASFTGVIGIFVAAFFLFLAAKNRRWWDLGISGAMVAAITLYFAMEWNYLPIRLLTF